MPDHHGLEALMSGNKEASSSPLEKLHAVEGNFVEYSKLPHTYLSKDPKTNINIENTLTGTESSSSQSANTQKSPYPDSASRSKLYEQIPSLTMEANGAGLNSIHHENGFTENSLPYIFSEKLRLSSNDVLFGQSVDTAKQNFEDDTFQSLEDLEARTIGNLLPDDDDLLAGAIHGFACVSQSNRIDDAEDDLFCSGGGMELEAGNKFGCNKTSDFRNGEAYGCQNGGLANHFIGKFPCDEHPTRTLLVRNIDSNADDINLRVLFEQYGEIHSLYTACKHHGLVVISYYDIRAAENAARALQNKPLRCHRLDIDFLRPKDYSLENNINQGKLVVVNLDSSISNDDIHQIFGAYGEIKEICEFPNMNYQKFIEFYDVRAAEVALYALNGCDIAGKRIKIEPSWPCGASAMQQFLLELKERESSGCRQDGLYFKSASECFVSLGLTTLDANSSKGLLNEAVEGIHPAVQIPTSSFVQTNFQGISSGVPHKLFSTVGVATVSNHSKRSGQSDSSHSLRPINFSLHCRQTFQRQSFPDFHDGVISAISYSTANTTSAMAMNMSSSLADGIDVRNTHGAVSSGTSSYSHDHHEVAFGTLGNGSCALHEHQYGWNKSSTYHQHPPSIMLWQNSPPFLNTQLPQVHELSRGISHTSSPVVPLHHQIVGSAPAVNTLLWDRRHTYAGDCVEVASLHPDSLGSVGFSSCSQLHSLECASRNIFPHATGKGIDSSMPGEHVRIPSQRRSQIFRARTSVNTMLTAYDGPSDRIRSRRSNASINQGDNKKQYELDIDSIIRGEDSRTTLMLKNIPNRYTSKMLLATIDEQHKGTYNFIYLPIDFKNKCNVGYAFINMIDPQHIIPFYKAFHGEKWEKFNSEKVASLAYARIQGKAALIAHFQNSSLMNEDKRCHPILFHSDGPNAGDQEPFPLGVNIRSRRSRTAVENHRRSLSSSSNDDEASSLGSTKDM